jgi:hypothetical protein
MNATSPDLNIERPWVTYVKAVVFILPAVIAWWLACIFLVPKAKEICQMAGLDEAQLGWISPATFFLVAWGRELLVAGVVSVGLLEFVAARRWRRGLVVGIGTWVANVAVLFALCMLLVLVLIAAPGLAHPR